VHTAKTGKHLSLTFDDGPSAYTGEVLDVLKEHHVTAVFCVVGDNVAMRTPIPRLKSQGWSFDLPQRTVTSRTLENAAPPTVAPTVAPATPSATPTTPLPTTAVPTTAVPTTGLPTTALPTAGPTGQVPSGDQLRGREPGQVDAG
jgi:hypothetical protein